MADGLPGVQVCRNGARAGPDEKSGPELSPPSATHLSLPQTRPRRT